MISIPKLTDLARVVNDEAIVVNFPGEEGGPIIRGYFIDAQYALLLADALTSAVMEQRGQLKAGPAGDLEDWPGGSLVPLHYLRPCPFCGGVPRMLPQHDEGYSIDCLTCQAKVQEFWCSPVSVALKWNRRLAP